VAHVILQPSANQDARDHYRDTIEAPVAFRDYAHLIAPETLYSLGEIFPDGVAPMWGVTPGVNGVNVRKYERASIGDLVLFAAHGRIFGSGTVAAKFRNRDLAAQLWNFDSKGMTWEYMYALDEIRTLDIPYADFNRVVGYKENNVIQGFTVMDSERSESFLDAFGFWSERHEPPVTEEILEDALINLDGPLDTRVQTWARTEQSRARRVHLGDRPVGDCRLCGRTFPREFLVAAHKKKRSRCSDDEKRDIANVTMMCCVFGCDALYERGYVGVSESGEILRSSRITSESALGQAIGQYVLPRISLDPREADYFAWHLKNTYVR